MTKIQSRCAPSGHYSPKDALACLKQRYHELLADRPGERFKKLHERRASRGESRKPLLLAFAIGLIAIGAILLILPGPGIPFLFAGFGLIAQEMLVVASALDRGELLVRKSMKCVKQWAARAKAK